MQPTNNETQKQKEQIIINAIAAVLSELRKRGKISQRLLAFENDLHKSLISRLESAKNQPMFLSVWKVAEALGLKPSRFVALVEKKLPPNFSLLDV